MKAALRTHVDLFGQRVAEQLEQESGMNSKERLNLVSGATSHFEELLESRLSRLLVLELRAHAVRGMLTSETPEDRWTEFANLAATNTFWENAYEAYPALKGRLERLTVNKVNAISELGRRLAADRQRLEPLVGTSELTHVQFGLGDSHRGGRMVTRLDFGDGSVVYKPRSLDADKALAALIDDLQFGAEQCVRVPDVLARANYGWSEFIQHRYCADEQELQRYYYGIGAWLAIMLLLRGRDLHHENIIACGPIPVLIDCEVLFSPRLGPKSAGLGDAVDDAFRMLDQTVAETGLLPWRDVRGHAVEGFDFSGVGALAGQQPTLPAARFKNLGRDDAELTIEHARLKLDGKNHPTIAPRPDLFEERIIEGFREYVERIGSLRSRNGLRVALARFNGSELRFVPRATQIYVEYGRALWHPSSLHDEDTAKNEICALLAERGASDLAIGDRIPVIEAEIRELLDDDIPIFTYSPDVGRIEGLQGIELAACGDLIKHVADSWETVNLALQEACIAASLAGLYRASTRTVSRASREEPGPPSACKPSLSSIARSVAEDLCRNAIVGSDGTVTWVGQNAGISGITAVPVDLYSGHAGISVALAAYKQACDRGAMEPVGGLEGILDGALEVLRKSVYGPDSLQDPGGFGGFAGDIWAYLTLHRLLEDDCMLKHAERAALRLSNVLDNDRQFDVVYGVAGSIVPLIGLTERTGECRYLDLAIRAARHLKKSANIDGETACWVPSGFVQAVTGFAHGSFGIGWALRRLHHASGDQLCAELADKAMGHYHNMTHGDALGRLKSHSSQDEEGHSPEEGWCYGATGVALASADLYRRVGDVRYLELANHLGEAIKTQMPRGDASLCHGDLGTWELLHELSHIDDEWQRRREGLQSIVFSPANVSSACAYTKGFGMSPGFMDGVSGLLYSLLRMNLPHTRLPSPLLQEC
ncbi:type 2 lanthipeptide synthetase LanM family protein [Catellatospora sp. NPDC049609]|uniref:type 2 lanthipeptide synthetase LanM family protein n=1 Tax=Catellatospora sp. NPDC049609 TaxID=3155505 RepID=UPI003421C0AB